MVNEWFFICHFPAMLPPSPTLPFRATDQVCPLTLTSNSFLQKKWGLKDYFSGPIVYQRGRPQVSLGFCAGGGREPKPSKITPGQFHYPREWPGAAPAQSPAL